MFTHWAPEITTQESSVREIDFRLFVVPTPKTGAECDVCKSKKLTVHTSSSTSHDLYSTAYQCKGTKKEICNSRWTATSSELEQRYWKEDYEPPAF